MSRRCSFRIAFPILLTHVLSSCSAPAIGTASPVPDTSEPVVEAQDIRFTGEVVFQTVDANLDGFYERLVAEVEVELLAGGEFTILGTLEIEGRHIANRPAYESMLFSDAHISAAPGITTAVIAFSGEQILQSGEDGPFDLILHAIGEESHANLTIQTPAFDHIQFAEIGAILKGVTNAAIDEDGGGRIESIESSIEVEVRTPEDYHLQGNLRRGEVEVDVGKRFTLPWGVHILKLRFPIPPTRRTGLIWPFEGVVNIIDADGHTIGSIEFLIDPLSIETTPEDTSDPSLALTLTPEKSTYDLEEADNLQLTARFENTSDGTLLLAHPGICLPGGLQEGESIPLDPNQSYILVRITTPADKQILLRNSIFSRFLLGPSEATSQDHLILAPGEAAEVIFYKFHAYSNINPWVLISEPIFSIRGSYNIQVVLKNNYPCAWFDETGCAEPWMGEVASNVILVEVE